MPSLADVIAAQAGAPGPVYEPEVLASVANTTTNITAGGNGRSAFPSISADGSSVVFATASTNLE